jgi:two-component system, NtrC family, sensor histidine kinase HydH
VRLAQADAEAKGVQILFTRDAALPPLMADGERLTQALLNLYLNAIQAMQSGGVLSISATRDPAAELLAVRIADTGQGMAPEILADIFNPYFTTKPSGTGLGLAIVHRIVEAHGGGIKVESLPGTGTTFTLLLPLAQPA